MWTKQIFGTEFLLLLECFILYSFIGWFVESVYMSFCNKKLTNRGFAILPLCPIYGCGGVIGYIILSPFAGNVVLLYFAGVITATGFELFVALLMQKFLHAFWWDYTEKPFNYKGMICLESSVAWGFYAIIIVKWLNGIMMGIVTKIPMETGKIICIIVSFAYLLDFIYHVLDAIDSNFRQKISGRKEDISQACSVFINRF